MSFTSKSANEVLVAGQQDTMFKIDLEKGTIVETVLERVPERKDHADHPRYLRVDITPK